jgi:DNA-binding CsgD family transcriptional regulator
VSRFKTGTGQRNTPHLLNGLICCRRCGQRLYMSSTSAANEAYRSYKCMTGRKEGRLTCSTVAVRADWVEQAVVEELSRVAQEPAMHRLIEQELAQATEQQDMALREERLALKRKLEQLQEQFDRWAEAYSRQVMGEKQFMAFSQKMQTEEEEASARLQQVEHDLGSRREREAWMASVRDALLDFPQVWQALDNDEKRQVLLLLLEDGQLQANRQGKEIHLSMKVHLLPRMERVIVRENQRGKNRTRAVGLQRLSQHQMTFLFWAGKGKSHRECAAEMGCSVQSLYSVADTIRKNLGSVSWAEAIEMTREPVEAYASHLPLHGPDQRKKHAAKGITESIAPFLSPVLMEVFHLFAQGATTAEVAKELDLPAHTVQGRRQRILRAFKTKSMLEAVRAAKEQGILVE